MNDEYVNDEYVNERWIKWYKVWVEIEAHNGHKEDRMAWHIQAFSVHIF